MRHKLWIITVLPGLALAACGVLEIGIETTGTPDGEPTPVDTPTGAPTGTPATPTPSLTMSLQTYHNDEVGFELDYPADWVQDLTGISHGVILWSKTVEGPGTDGVPADVAKIDVLALPDVTQTLDELVAQQKQSLADTNGTVLSEERLQLASGLEAVQMRVQGFGGEAMTLLAIIHGHPVIITGFGDLSHFEEVARTLRPTEGTGTAPLGFTCSVAYAEGTLLFCLSEGGTPVPIAQVDAANTFSGPAISPDGAWVAYMVHKVDETGELWAVDVRTLISNDGLNLPRRRLVGADQIGYGQPEVISSPLSYAWRSGTHILYFNTRFAPVGDSIGPGEYTYNDLWTVNAVTGEVLNILSRDSVGQFYLAPDGQYIGISNPQSIGIIRADGTDFRLFLEFPFVSTYSEYAYKPALVWSPDSAFLSVVVPSADPLAADASAALYRMTVAGEVQTLATFPGSFVFGGPSAADASPDGQRLAYVRTDQGTSTMSLHLVNADGTDDVTVAQDATINGLGWSPDSTHFAYTIVPGGSSYLAGLEGAPQVYAPDTQTIALQWVDGLSFYFLGAGGDTWALYFQRLGEPGRMLVDGLSGITTFDVRKWMRQQSVGPV